MNKVEFTVEGVEGCFVCDSDEVRSYKTAKELAKSDKDFSLAFDVMERVFIGNDEKYIERMGGDVERIQDLLSAAIKACGAKNSSASSQTSNGDEAK